MGSTQLADKASGYVNRIGSLATVLDSESNEEFNYISLSAVFGSDCAGQGELEELVQYALANPSLLSGRMEISLQTDERQRPLIRVGQSTDENVNDNYRELYARLTENRVKVNGDSLASTLEDQHQSIKSDGMEEKSAAIAEFCSSLSEWEGGKVNISIDLSKKKIAQKALQQCTIEKTADDYLPQFWTSFAAMEEVIKRNGFRSYLDNFQATKQPVVFLLRSPHDSLRLPVFEIGQEGSLTEEEYQQYKCKIEAMEEFTAFSEGIIPLPPSFFIPPETTHPFRYPFTYGLLSLLSDRVSIESIEDESSFDFRVNSGATDVSGAVSIINTADHEEGDESLLDVYRNISVHDEQETFVDLWRRCLAHHCDNLSELPRQSQRVIDRYKAFESDLVDSQLQELSNAIRDVHTFMNDLVNQVTTTSANLSNELQRLTLTVAVALLTNIFLIARKQSLDVVLSLSYIILAVLIVGYLPIVEERIDELNTLRRYTKKDFDAYQSILRQYAGESLNISKIDNRRRDYNKHVHSRVTDAQRRLRRIFFVSVGAGVGLSYYTAYYLTTISQAEAQSSIQDWLIFGQISMVTLYVIIAYQSSGSNRLLYTFETPELTDGLNDQEPEYSLLEKSRITPTHLIFAAALLALGSVFWSLYELGVLEV